jgi:hypothetical protein
MLKLAAVHWPTPTSAHGSARLVSALRSQTAAIEVFSAIRVIDMMASEESLCECECVKHRRVSSVVLQQRGAAARRQQLHERKCVDFQTIRSVRAILRRAGERAHRCKHTLFTVGDV